MVETSTDVETLIRSLEDRRYTAIIEGDFDAFATLAHPQLAYTHSDGITDTLSSYLDKCTTGFYVYHRIDHPIDFVRVVDDVALVVGEMNATITAGGTDKELRNRCLAVWKTTPQGWKLLAYQPTPTP